MDKFKEFSAANPGLTASEIAEKFGIAERTVGDRCRKLHIKLSSPRGRKGKSAMKTTTSLPSGGQPFPSVSVETEGSDELSAAIKLMYCRIAATAAAYN
jgi:predicted transcriptional regulator